MLKKSIARFVALLVLAAMLAALLSGCVFIKENKERIANKPIITINGANGITMTITQNEILDYYNNYSYYLVNYYGYSVEQVMDFAIESKIKNKYLITIAMGYLTKDVAKRTKDILVGAGSMNNPVDVLTHAEYFAAIAAVNKTIEDTIQGYIDDSYQQELNRTLSNADKENIEKIEFSEETQLYLKDEYYVGQEIDKDRISIVIFYKDSEGKETQSEPIIAPTSAYSTDFTSEEAGDKELVVKVEEKIVSNGETTYETHEAKHSYKITAPRATKTEKEEVKPDEITINDIKVDRYDTMDTLRDKGAEVLELNIEAKYEALKDDPTSDSYTRDAYRQMIEALSRNFKTIRYLYDSAYESAVISALQAEVEKTALKENEDDWDQAVLNQFEFLYESAKAKYIDGEDVDLAFANSITSGLESFYYHPKVENLGDYFYVYQILFNFSDEQKNFLTNNTSDDREDIKKEFYEFISQSIESKISNPDYDAEYGCEKHAKGDPDAECKWAKEHDGDETGCKSLAYEINEDGSIKTELFSTVYRQLSEALDGLSGEEALAEFEKYMYMYNDDPGVMNASAGYLIVPGDKDPNGFYQAFIDLAKEVYEYGVNTGDPLGNAFTADGVLGYTFTDYGVHIIMVSMVPFDHSQNDQELEFVDRDEMLVYIKNTVINQNGDTIYDILKEKVIADAKSLAYSDFTNAKIPNDMHEDSSKVSKDKKAIDKLYENYVNG